MKCPVCYSENSALIYKSHVGYVEDTYYDIYVCKDCDTQFIDDSQNLSEIYETIYKSTDNTGYDRYHEYAQKILGVGDALEFLAKEESTYFPVFDFLKGKKNLDILEIGCGYGYLTFAMKSAGHTVLGIDISVKAVEFANKHFGNFFRASDIANLQLNDQKYDLIVATELVEHLNNINLFFETSKNLLKNTGYMIVTTPNRDFYKNIKVCQTDLPPVHMLALSKKSIETLALNHNLFYKYIEECPNFSRSQNKLIQVIQSRINPKPIFVLDKNGAPYIKTPASTNLKFVEFAKKILFLKSIRYFSNYIGMLINQEPQTLHVLFSNTKLKN